MRWRQAHPPLIPRLRIQELAPPRRACWLIVVSWIIFNRQYHIRIFQKEQRHDYNSGNGHRGGGARTGHAVPGGAFNQAMESLYGENIVSVEAQAMPNMPREMRGMNNIRKKAQWWEANHTVHTCAVTGPFIAGDKFAVMFLLDFTDKPTGKRHQMSEIAVYTVSDGKIVHEEFLNESK